jgi:excisionase family DNA binding protein
LTISVEQAARHLGIGRGAAYDAARRGELPTIRLGRRLVVPLKAFNDWLAGKGGTHREYLPDLTADSLLGPIIYFLEDQNQRIKIGFSMNFGQRLHQYRTHNGDNLTILGVMKGSKFVEAFLHHAFESLHIKGEWFKADERLKRFIFDVTYDAPSTRDQPE